MADAIEVIEQPNLTLVKPKRKYTRRNPLEPKVEKVTATSYRGYTINSIYTNEKGNCIYFKDTTMSHLPCFMFDFKTRTVTFEDGRVAPSSYIYKIRNNIEGIANVAKRSSAPFWVVSYLVMITSPFNRYESTISKFYNAFTFRREGPHPSILSIMNEAEVVAKAGFCVCLSNTWGKMYTEDELTEFRKSSHSMRKTLSSFWTDPYSTDFAVFPNTNYRLGELLYKSKTLSNPILMSFMAECDKHGPEGKMVAREVGNTNSWRNEQFINDMTYLNGTLGYDIRRIAKYLVKDADYQGLELDNTLGNLTLLKDYARMTYEALGNTKFNKYPSFLKTQHDIALKNYRIKEDQILKAKFGGVVAETEAKLPNLNLKGKDYVMLIPQSMQDIITEGARQHHCVASYAKNVANRQTTILFLRKKETPEDALVTVEVRNLFSEDINRPANIGQAKGNSNRNVSEEEHEFLKEWAKKNNISYGND